ncbi:MAG: hypothetical protein ABFR05_00295 [Bacteroidota bacterium]
MNKNYIYYLGLILGVLSVACEQKADDENAIARVNKTYLYEEDFVRSLPDNITKEDSALFRANYINSWATKQLLLQKAQLNIDEEASEINDLVREYRTELLIDRYKEAVLKQELDTVVTSYDIDQYYEKNKNIYRLNEDLVKIKFISFHKDINKSKDLIDFFKSKDSTDFTRLIDRSLELNSFNFNDSIWVRYPSVLNKIPILKETELKKVKFLQKEDSLGVYLVTVKDVLYRNEIAPQSYVKNTIKQMILHKHKLELLKTLEKTLLEDATKNKQFETINKDD